MRSTAGISSPGIKTAATMLFLEVSIARWIVPAGDVTLGITGGSFRRYGSGYWVSCTFQLPATRDLSQEAYWRSLGAGRFILSPEIAGW
jgi:hypothetical protein